MKKFIVKNLIIFVMIFALVFMLTGCTAGDVKTSTAGSEEEKELTVYSGRQERFIVPLVEKFQKETGIKVNLISGKATEYAHRIIEEGANTQADVFISNDGGILEYLRTENMLAPIESKLLDKIPSNYVGRDKLWTALTFRHRVFMYNTDLIKAEDMPKSIFDLTNPEYKGQFAMNRAGNEAMINYFASIHSILGQEKTLELLKGIMANKPLVLQGSTDVRKAVGSGEVKFGLISDNQYEEQLKEEGNNHVAVIYPDQGTDGIGAFVNISGLAIPKYAKHPKNALRFIEFLLQPEQQVMSDEDPIIPGIVGGDYKQVKTAAVSVEKVWQLWDKTTELMERAKYSD